jgi:hypothetical protein
MVLFELRQIAPFEKLSKKILSVFSIKCAAKDVAGKTPMAVEVLPDGIITQVSSG